MPTDNIDAVVSCVGYADMLAITLPLHRHHFREFVVVTKADDMATIAVCERNNARALITDAYDAPGDVPEEYGDRPRFNKGAALNVGFDSLADPGWVLVLDSDIIVPGKVARHVARKPMPRDMLYGVHRCDIPDPHWLQRWREDRSLVERFRRIRSAPGVGYFQLFHVDAWPLAKSPIYPEHYGYAGGCDTWFRNRFPRTHILPGCVLHLYHGPHKANWFGRPDDNVRWDAAESEAVA